MGIAIPGKTVLLRRPPGAVWITTVLVFFRKMGNRDEKNNASKTVLCGYVSYIKPVFHTALIHIVKIDEAVNRVAIWLR